MTQLKAIFFFLSFTYLSCFSCSYSQSNPFLADSVQKNKFWLTTGLNTGLWVGTITTLNFAWYKGYEKSKFHFFNDGHEWQQMDKMGHASVSWLFANTTASLYQKTGLSTKKSAVLGSLFSIGYMTTFECLDAYNTNWGFSWQDIGANTIGTGLFFFQSYFWEEQKIKLKFSTHQTDLAMLRPNVLGNSFSTRLLKDYNGQTYWLTASPFNFNSRKHEKLNWLGLAFGYSINHQLYGNGDTYIIANINQTITYTPYRQYFLSLDVDFEKIPVKSKFLKVMFKGLNFIKIPFPALEYSNQNLKGHWLYF